jgi:hypothetical protein
MGCMVCSILEGKKYLQNWILCINVLGKKIYIASPCVVVGV